MRSSDQGHTSSIVIHTDGASRGNPGLSAIGVIISQPDGIVLRSTGQRIGRATNNEAEYRAVIAGLEQAQAMGMTDVTLRMDSELVCRQLQGTYRVRSETLAPLHGRAKQLLGRFRSVSIVHIPRAKNALADRLANQALDGESQ